MQPPFLIGNWKMKLSVKESIALARGLAGANVLNFSGTVVVCPSFTALAGVKEALGSTNIFLGAQDVGLEERGAETGAVSVLQLVDLGCKYVIVGHSERRYFFGETDEQVQAKVAVLLKHDVVPIVCVGETAKERATGETEAVLRRQVKAAMQAVEDEDIIIAYEPVWAISPNPPAVASEVLPMLDIIRSVAGADNTVIYGGSVSADNIREYVGENAYAGALVGSESLQADTFLAMLAKL